MEKVDYKKLGFRCGVEIHQQLFTEKKLFCRCPAGCYSKEVHAEVLRHMRPTLSEMGVYDGTALMEFKTKKEILYRLNNETVCTYEMDDTPPFPVNEDALNIAIEIALLLGSTVCDEIHIARKQYLDGSIPTGFQRTTIIGMGGEVQVGGKKIHIRQFAMEEDACREISDIGHTITFRTDRLGMPLVEIVTEPDMESPEEAAEVVRQLGRLMRVTGKVRRGIGAVRQDVNVSIAGGTRVEIKGVPRYQNIPKLTHVEALRQKALLDITKELTSRVLSKEKLVVIERDLTGILENTQSEMLKRVYQNGWRIRGIKAENISGILNIETQPGKTFAHELSGRVKVIACIDHVPNIYHTDNWPEYTGWQKDHLRVKLALDLKENDVGIIVWGPNDDTVTAFNEIRDRMLEAFDGVPSETRKACFDGTTDFERILPGPDRMYPDTDHPPVKITRERVASIAKGLPVLPWELEKKYKKLGMPLEVIDQLPISKYVPLVEKLGSSLEPKLMKTVGVTLFQTMKDLRRNGVPVDNIPDEDLCQFFVDFSKNKFKRKDFKSVLTSMANRTTAVRLDL